VLRFLSQVVRSTWEGKLGTRQASAINGSLRLMLQFDADIRHLKEIEVRMDALQQELEEFDMKVQHQAHLKPAGEVVSE